MIYPDAFEVKLGFDQVRAKLKTVLSFHGWTKLG
jgi:hypothetical protein